VFKQDYFRGGLIDGDFGAETARACMRAKYWLGYPTHEQKPTFGNFLLAYLSGNKNLPRANLFYRARRLRLDAKKAKNPLNEKALKVGYTHLGKKENPRGSNRCFASVRWGLIGAWCDMFFSENYIDAGSKAFNIGRRDAYVPYTLQRAVRGDDGLSIVRASVVKPGDGVAYDWDNDNIPDHIGHFVKWILYPTQFVALEGNTALGNDSNGGQVMERDRALVDVATYHGLPAFIHVYR
jgi:hypothetical protein